MKISVIIPVYNGEKYIAETLDCLLNQTLEDIQIIIVNDGSTDSTENIIKEYSSKSSKILSINQENSGVSAARNNGIENAEGEYIIFIDSDDLLSKNALENLYNALKETKADLAVFRIESFGIGGNSFNSVVDSISKDEKIDCYDKRLVWNYLVSNKCYRTELLKNSGVRFPSMKYSEDGAFFMKFVHTVKPKITGVFDAVFKYRRHEGSVTHRVNTPLLEDFLKSINEIYSCAENSFEDAPGRKEDYLQEILKKGYSSLINEFYRMLWFAEDENSLAVMGRINNELTAKMNDSTKNFCQSISGDIGKLYFSKQEIALNPVVTVIASKPSDKFVESLYRQSMPIFELITADEEKVKNQENIKIISENDFKANAKGKIIISFKGDEILDSRFLKTVVRLKKSKVISALPSFVIKFAVNLLFKIK